ncbi:MAG: Hpt domain-containing protein [Oscillospiraceae bacterium]
MDFTLLTEVGINVEEAVKRCAGNEALYAGMVKRFVEEESYRNLVIAAENHDEKQMLSVAHTLKGLCGILSLTPLYELLCELVVLLKNGENDKAFALMPEISDSYEKITRAISDWKSASEITAGQ